MSSIKWCAAVCLLALAGCGGGGGGEPLAPPPVASAPVLTAQPQSQTVEAGSTASFSVQASGDAPLAFQWMRDGQPLAAANASTFSLPNAQPSDSGASLTVRVSNPGGTVTSAAALLAVLQKPLALSLVAGDIAFVNKPDSATAPVPRDGTGADARFGPIVGLAVDGSGTVYVAEEQSIRKIDRQGRVTTLAGGVAGYADGAGAAARFGALGGIAADQAGNVYASDLANTAIRKITPAGLVTTLAGGPARSGHADGPIATALVAYPGSVAVDAFGAVYFVDGPGYRNPPNIGQRVRRISVDGVLATVAGAEVTDFSRPGQLAVDGAGNVYLTATVETVSICVRENCFYNVASAFIRKITPAGVVSVVAGSNAATGLPTSLAIDALGNLFVADAPSHVVRKLSPSGVVSVLAGTTPSPVSQPSPLPPFFPVANIPNVVPGPLPASLKYPTLVATAPDGSVYTTSSPYSNPGPAYMVLKAGAP